MTAYRHRSPMAMIGLLVLTQTALAQGTEQEREACTPDVFRLCGAYIPDADRIVACLRGNPDQLSRACYSVLYPPQQSTSLRRSQQPPALDRRPVQVRPQDDDDD